METKVRIIEIKPVEEAFISKEFKSFSAPIYYVLENGQQIKSVYRRTRKKDVKAFLDSLPVPPRNPLYACFDDNGNFYGTEEHFTIGG